MLLSRIAYFMQDYTVNLRLAYIQIHQYPFACKMTMMSVPNIDIDIFAAGVLTLPRCGLKGPLACSYKLVSNDRYDYLITSNRQKSDSTSFVCKKITDFQSMPCLKSPFRK